MMIMNQAALLPMKCASWLGVGVSLLLCACSSGDVMQTPGMNKEHAVEIDTELRSDPGDVIVHLGESASGWTGSGGVTTTTSARREGERSLQSTGSGTDRFRHKTLPQLDVRSKRYLTFWYYISDASSIRSDRDGQVEISSSGSLDREEMSWDVRQLNLHDGWNFVRLDMQNRGSNGIDLSRVKRFRLYHYLSGGVTTRIDDIRFTNDIVWDLAETETGWGGSQSVLVDTNNFKQGSASLVSQGNGTDRFSRNDLPRADVSEYSYLTFWYYVNDASRIRTDRDAQVELSSNTSFDREEMSWDVRQLDLKDGWNFVRLDMRGRGSNGIDLSRVRRFRLYHFLTGTVTTRLDDVRFTNNPHASDCPLSDGVVIDGSGVAVTGGAVGAQCSAPHVDIDNYGASNVLGTRIIYAGDDIPTDPNQCSAMKLEAEIYRRNGDGSTTLITSTRKRGAWSPEKNACLIPAFRVEDETPPGSYVPGGDYRIAASGYLSEPNSARPAIVRTVQPDFNLNPGQQFRAVADLLGEMIQQRIDDPESIHPAVAGLFEDRGEDSSQIMCRLFELEVAAMDVMRMAFVDIGARESSVDLRQESFRELHELACTGLQDPSLADLQDAMMDYLTDTIRISRDVQDAMELSPEAAAQLIADAYAQGLAQIRHMCRANPTGIYDYVRTGSTPSNMIGKNPLLLLCPPDMPQMPHRLGFDFGPNQAEVRRQRLRECLTPPEFEEDTSCRDPRMSESADAGETGGSGPCDKDPYSDECKALTCNENSSPPCAFFPRLDTDTDDEPDSDEPNEPPPSQPPPSQPPPVVPPPLTEPPPVGDVEIGDITYEDGSGETESVAPVTATPQEAADATPPRTYADYEAARRRQENARIAAAMAYGRARRDRMTAAFFLALADSTGYLTGEKQIGSVVTWLTGSDDAGWLSGKFGSQATGAVAGELARDMALTTRLLKVTGAMGWIGLGAEAYGGHLLAPAEDAERQAWEEFCKTTPSAPGCLRLPNSPDQMCPNWELQGRPTWFEGDNGQPITVADQMAQCLCEARGMTGMFAGCASENEQITLACMGSPTTMPDPETCWDRLQPGEIDRDALAGEVCDRVLCTNEFAFLNQGDCDCLQPDEVAAATSICNWNGPDGAIDCGPDATLVNSGGFCRCVSHDTGFGSVGNNPTCRSSTPDLLGGRSQWSALDPDGLRAGIIAPLDRDALFINAGTQHLLSQRLFEGVYASIGDVMRAEVFLPAGLEGIDGSVELTCDNPDNGVSHLSLGEISLVGLNAGELHQLDFPVDPQARQQCLGQGTAHRWGIVTRIPENRLERVGLVSLGWTGGLTNPTQPAPSCVEDPLDPSPYYDPSEFTRLMERDTVRRGPVAGTWMERVPFQNGTFGDVTLVPGRPSFLPRSE